MTVADHGITPDLVGGTVTQAQIDQAVHTIITLCGWQPWPVRRETLVVRAPGDPEVFLPTTRLAEVHSITIDGKNIDVEDIEWWEDGILEVTPSRRGGWPRRFRVEADVTHGHDVGALLGLVGAMARRAAQPQEDYSVGRISVSAPGTMTPQSTEWRIIDQFKLGPMP